MPYANIRIFFALAFAAVTTQSSAKSSRCLDPSIANKVWGNVVSLRFTFVAFSILTMLGCASPPLDSEVDYPSSFPKLSAEASACPAFSGMYLNRGLSFNPSGGAEQAALLSRDVLKISDTFDESDALRISVETRPISTNMAEIRAIRVTTPSGRAWNAPKEKLGVCNKGKLFYIYESGVGGTPGLLAIVGNSAELHVAVDGSLIVRTSELTSGIAVVVPFRSRTNTVYYRFPVAADEPAKQN